METETFLKAVLYIVIVGMMIAFAFVGSEDDNDNR